MEDLTPEEIQKFTRLADLFTKRKYNLNILSEEHEYPLLSKAIEDHFKNSERRKTLLLPELTFCYYGDITHISLEKGKIMF